MRPDANSERLGSDGADVETWWFAAWGLRDGAALWEQITVHRRSRRTWYVAALADPGRSSVLVVDDEMPWPRPERYLEIRGRGIWSHHVCEEPLQRWSVGIEAAGVAHDDPAAGLDDGWGAPDGLAADLEWEATGPVISTIDGYVHACRVDGVLERVGEEIHIDEATGARGRYAGSFAARAGSLTFAGDVGLAEADSKWSPVELPRHGTFRVGETEVSVMPDAHAAWRLPDGTVTAIASVTTMSAAGVGGAGIARWVGRSLAD